MSPRHPRMTRAHFEAIAASVREANVPEDVRARLIEHWRKALIYSNPRFNPTRFAEACQPKGAANVQ